MVSSAVVVAVAAGDNDDDDAVKVVAAVADSVAVQLLFQVGKKLFAIIKSRYQNCGKIL